VQRVARLVVAVVVVAPAPAAAALTGGAEATTAAAAAASSTAAASATTITAAASAAATTTVTAEAAAAAATTTASEATTAAAAAEAAAAAATEAALTRRPGGTGSTAAAAAATTTLAFHGGVAANAAPVEGRAVHGLQRRPTGCVVGEGHEAEAPTPSRVAILDHDRIHHFAKGFKRCAQRRVVRRPRQSANKQLHGVLFLFSFADQRGRMVVLPDPEPATSRVPGGVLTTLESYQ
jgi:hypothetical protein